MRPTPIQIHHRRPLGLFAGLAGLLLATVATMAEQPDKATGPRTVPGSAPVALAPDGSNGATAAPVTFDDSFADASPSRLPAGLLQLPADTGAALVVDLTDNRLYVFENHAPFPRLVADLYVSIGKGGIHKRREGDEKTPVGVYFVTGFIPGSELPELYGAGAFPVDYPNLWDRYRKRTGSGIWIHGNPDAEVSRPPRASRGCLTLANDDFRALAAAIEPGRTPVVISERADWLEPGALDDLRSEVLAAQDAWRRAWEELDTDAYLAFYAPDFRYQDMDYAAWARHKRRVNARKSYIRVALEEVGLYRYPGEDDLVLADYVQRYRSNDFQRTSRKRQLWQRRDGHWRIIAEGRR